MKGDKKWVGFAVVRTIINNLLARPVTLVKHIASSKGAHKCIHGRIEDIRSTTVSSFHKFYLRSVYRATQIT